MNLYISEDERLEVLIFPMPSENKWMLIVKQYMNKREKEKKRKRFLENKIKREKEKKIFREIDFSLYLQKCLYDNINDEIY